MLRRMRCKGRGDDRGMTLVELLIAMSIFSVLMALLMSLMISMMYQAKDNFARARAVEQARIGLSQIDKQVRSGNVILDPALDGMAQAGVPANYSLRIYTQEGGSDMCVQWRVIFPLPTSKFGQLEYREWESGSVATVTDWYRVASNVVKPSGTLSAADSSTWPPFWIDTSQPTGTAAKNVRLTLRVSDPDAKTDSKPIAVTSVVTGRNTVFGYSPLTCSTVPAP